MAASQAKECNVNEGIRLVFMSASPFISEYHSRLLARFRRLEHVHFGYNRKSCQNEGESVCLTEPTSITISSKRVHSLRAKVGSLVSTEIILSIYLLDMYTCLTHAQHSYFDRISQFKLILNVKYQALPQICAGSVCEQCKTVISCYTNISWGWKSGMCTHDHLCG